MNVAADDEGRLLAMWVPSGGPGYGLIGSHTAPGADWRAEPFVPEANARGGWQVSARAGVVAVSLLPYQSTNLSDPSVSQSVFVGRLDGTGWNRVESPDGERPSAAVVRPDGAVLVIWRPELVCGTLCTLQGPEEIRAAVYHPGSGLGEVRSVAELRGASLSAPLWAMTSSEGRSLITWTTPGASASEDESYFSSELGDGSWTSAAPAPLSSNYALVPDSEGGIWALGSTAARFSGAGWSAAVPFADQALLLRAAGGAWPTAAWRPQESVGPGISAANELRVALLHPAQGWITETAATPDHSALGFYDVSVGDDSSAIAWVERTETRWTIRASRSAEGRFTSPILVQEGDIATGAAGVMELRLAPLPRGGVAAVWILDEPQSSPSIWASRCEVPSP